MSEPQNGSASSDAALDSLAAILRALAESAAKGGDGGQQAAESLEGWARHVLVLTPPPGREVGDPPFERDWPGLRRFAVTHVRQQGDTVAEALGGLQDVIWTMIEGMSRAVLDEAAADEKATECLERLKAAAASSTEELKKTAVATIGELGELLESKKNRQRALARELGEKVDVLRSELEDTRREAEIDWLTQLANRAVLERELQRVAHMRTLTGEPCCVLMVDVDNFKAVNDRHGHQAGDEALAAIAKVLTLNFPRRSDTVARYGGDEFAVILRNATELDTERMALRFLHAVRELALAPAGERITVSVSVGVADGLSLDSPASWLERADKALYAAKQAGRDRVELASATAV